MKPVFAARRLQEQHFSSPGRIRKAPLRARSGSPPGSTRVFTPMSRTSSQQGRQQVPARYRSGSAGARPRHPSLVLGGAASPMSPGQRGGVRTALRGSRAGTTAGPAEASARVGSADGEAPGSPTAPRNRAPAPRRRSGSPGAPGIPGVTRGQDAAGRAKTDADMEARWRRSYCTCNKPHSPHGSAACSPNEPAPVEVRRSPPEPPGISGSWTPSTINSTTSQRCPDGLLERLLASSPKPPRWASNQELLGSDDNDLDAGAAVNAGGPPLPHTPTPLGKWGRNSQVGAQVHSASDLHAVRSVSELQTVDDLSKARVNGSALRMASEGVGPDRTSFSLNPNSGSHRAALYQAASLKVLPPKPNFPPPGGEAPPLGRAAELVAQLRSNEAAPVLAAVARALLDSTSPTDENAPPYVKGVTGPVAWEPPPPGPSTDAQGLRGEVQRFSAEAAQVLRSRADAVEVVALLRRVDALLHTGDKGREKGAARWWGSVDVAR